jgi:excisionase family DNA binding protein
MSVTVDFVLNGARVPVELDDQALAAIAAAIGHAGVASATPSKSMNAETAANYLDVSIERIRKLKERQEIPFHQEGPGCRVLFTRTDLDKWMTTFRHDAKHITTR